MVHYKKFRFDFSPKTTEILSIFSNAHCKEKRKEFQTSWNEWIKSREIKSIIDEECELLKKNGFTGDVLDKMYKSARYYYTKRITKPIIEKTTRQHTNRFSQEFLREMDKVIERQILNDLKQNEEIEKSQIAYFEEFCRVFTVDIIKELRKIKQEKGVIPNDIKEKLKKTYKNRFYKNRAIVVNNKNINLMR
tara:strand:+ start:71 stop:646 length:576 start_codon:yes stop_codon:yes gene_type:complete